MKKMGGLNRIIGLSISIILATLYFTGMVIGVW